MQKNVAFENRRATVGGAGKYIGENRWLRVHLAKKLPDDFSCFIEEAGELRQGAGFLRDENENVRRIIIRVI